MFMLTHLNGFGVRRVTAPPSGPVVTHRGTFTTAGSVNSITQNDVSIGVAAAGRLVVVTGHIVRAAAAQRTFSAVTFNGSGGTIHGQTGINDGVNEGVQVGIMSGVVATGTTVDIVVTWSSLLPAGLINVYSITGLASATPTETLTTTGNDPSVTTLDVSASGVIIGAFGGVEPSTGAFTLSGVTADDDRLHGSGGTNMRAAAGHASGLSATSAYTVGCSSSAGFEALVASSWA
ncbi:hypothetical protein EN781_11270 [Mesorhizobium sp. M4A.F.Ca.ET.090.04.2.1]|uniref:hypothetical protein n=1 Tax=Mesorhizobium sp. M4A.F.Ca.ET.090.04.2.1 TaxID=2496663 RepID=UPI000FCB397F|nr:hypothetical protein [Mesorhizobium sp. M4A.F.Ca.ET.090.04.2.1]RVC45109.1 hypothetical protein EN781_11270 [Mesorhizobium sp. M4A.F.Ca.ET.090.04.2.1]